MNDVDAQMVAELVTQYHRAVNEHYSVGERSQGNEVTRQQVKMWADLLKKAGVDVNQLGH